MKPRESAAVVLTRGDGVEREVFLARRSPKLAFFPGFWALPGGGLDRSDGGDLRRCAMRELFEETGVRADGREAELVPVGTFTTPAFSKRRYRTQYFHLALPEGETPVVCGSELVEGRFGRPAAFLGEWVRGELSLASPVRALLEFLADAPTIEAFRAAVEAAQERPRAACNSPGVRVLPLAAPTLPPATTTNCYVVGEERLFVVDPAAYEDVERVRLFRVLDGLVAEGRAIEAVLATHHHRDHVGSIAGVCERYGVAVRGHRETLARLPEGCAPGEPLGDGDVLALGTAPDGTKGWDLEALFTPGHDRGHLCFRESRYGALIAGDMVSTLSTIVIDPPEGHLATYLASLERLRALPPGFVYPAHGMVHTDSRALMTSYLEHRAAREAALVAALDEGLSELDELVARVYADVDPALHGLAKRSLVAGMEKLSEG